MNADRDLATEPLDELDERILTAIADVLRAADPVPAGLADDVKFALTVQALHAEVAELQRVGAESALARSEYTRTQTLTFSAETLSVMVTLSPIDAEEVRVDGWVTGHDSAVTVEIRGEARTLSVEVDDDGRFTIDPAPRGLVRFVFLPEGDVRPVITPTVEI
ncbi:carboxypeptidase regulatory-like domain-containing protein [Oryzobacter terrae]|uniref:carboxypeptidase regulatory-like domain-containing protein n=1 Tax=Oryzobacter terrae TaxID=1620385 RepID=UPI00366BE8F0